MRLTDEGGDKRRRTSQGLPLIRPSVRTGAPSPHSGEGFGPAQIGRNSALCGTFGYIYWKLRRSAPVGGRAARMCRPYRRGGGNLPPHPPQCAHWGTCPYPLCPFGTSSLPLLAFGHFPLTGGIGPLTRGVGPQGEGLGKTKRDRFLTCPLKHRGETQFRIKFLCFLSFSKKGSYTGPWRKRSIISWVREMADPPWGRFSRSNQVPSPSSSSWRVTVSSSVSRSQ